jgi:hypothetical protein
VMSRFDFQRDSVSDGVSPRRTSMPPIACIIACAGVSPKR